MCLFGQSIQSNNDLVGIKCCSDQVEELNQGMNLTSSTYLRFHVSLFTALMLYVGMGTIFLNPHCFQKVPYYFYN